VPRRFRSLEEKQRIIAEATASGASVAAVARKHGVNANLVFAWMRLQEQGTLATRTRRSRPKLLAVSVAPEPAAPAQSVTNEHLEIVLPDGTRVRVFGEVPVEQLERVLRLLRR
jgi:transposase